LLQVVVALLLVVEVLVDLERAHWRFLPVPIPSLLVLEVQVQVRLQMVAILYLAQLRQQAVVPEVWVLVVPMVAQVAAEF
jgi:hypothetical protein